MQLQQPAKREPYRPPPRELEPPDPDDAPDDDRPPNEPPAPTNVADAPALQPESVGPPAEPVASPSVAVTIEVAENLASTPDDRPPELPEVAPADAAPLHAEQPAEGEQDAFGAGLDAASG